MNEENSAIRPDPEFCISRYHLPQNAPPINNPYLFEILELIQKLTIENPGDLPARLLPFRNDMVTRYSFSIPTIDILEIIAGYSPLIEIGAGSGYWAMCLKQLGTDIIAFDKHPPENMNPWWESGNPWFDTEWHAVYEGDESIAADYPGRSLLLCWPPIDSSMALNALKAYSDAGGKTLIYIGDQKSSGSEEFHRMLTRFELLLRKRLWSWYGVEDRLEIYRLIQS